jgi:CheY-like chemotaxis protein
MDKFAAQAQPRPFVLVVDDQNQVRTLMARVLSEAGHVVMEAEDGLEALDIIESYAGALHLVVTDVTMPRVSGTELAAQIKQRWPRIPILYVSGRELPQGAPDAPRLNKPFLPDELTTQVRALLAEPH